MTINLHAIVAPLVGAINPPKTVRVLRSIGYTTNADGRQVPTYANPVTIDGQLQDLSSKDIMQTANLNLQTQTRKIYLYGQWEGVVREDRRGGDLIMAEGSTWLVVSVVESWPGWCAVIVTRQND